ncbi:MAG: PEGA domain-containing protein [Verrucomicrobiae bacterium]|nr:PEGA domain-containing protein [Verrucomicrobiae bacterium]
MIKRVGKYEIIEKLGEGSYGIVYKARALEGPMVGGIVALKQLRATVFDPNAKARLEQEATTLMSFDHANIVRCYDYFEDTEGLVSTVYIVLEYIDGRSLDAWIMDHQKGLPVVQVLDIMIQTARGLAYSASHGITHRDVKPSNIIICHDGIAKILDYGVALGAEGTLGTIGEYRGSLDYMDPEYAKTEENVADELSDIYSFGITFLEALTGKHPYKRYAATVQEAYISYVRWAQSVTENDILPACPAFRNEKLAWIFQRSIATDRERRWPSFSEILKELEAIHRTYFRGEGGEEYRIVKPLGEGAFGSVFLAERLQDSTHVAIKKLGNVLAKDRFLSEVKILQKMEHPHIVDYLDHYCRHSRQTEGIAEYGLVMEYLDGPTLLERIRKTPKGLPLREVLRLFIGYAAALKYCQQHTHVVCHRDIKPGNLFAAPTQEPKIFDFGITRQMGDMTSGHIPGTLDYMAPDFVRLEHEEFRGDITSDLYSIGVCLYESLTGKLPFDRFSRDMKKALQQYIQRSQGAEQKIDFSHPVFSSCPPLKQVITSLLSRQRSERFAEAADLKRTLTMLQEALPELDDEVPTSADEEAPPTINADVSFDDRKPNGTMTFDPETIKDVDKAKTLSSKSMWFGRLIQGLCRVPITVKILLPVLLVLFVVMGISRSCRARKAHLLHQRIQHACTSSNWVEVGTLCQAGIRNYPGDERFTDMLDHIPGVCAMHITTWPTGALIRFCGQPKGTSPLVLTNMVAGEGMLDIRLDGYIPFTQNLILQEGSSTNIEVMLKKPFGIVTIKTDPDGATVWLNGAEHSERTPCTVFECPTGAVEIKVLRDGYRTASKLIEVASGVTITANIAALDRKVGTLTVESDPCGARVTIDSEFSGITPTTINAIPAGKHTLHTELLHYASVIRPVIIKDQELKIEKVQLVPLPATLHVISEPPGATVYINGEPLPRQTPATIDLQPNILHKIELSKAGYAVSEQQNIMLDPKSTETMSFTLVRLHGSLIVTGLVAGARVRIDGVETPVMADGVYEKSGIPVGKHLLSIQKEGYRALPDAYITIAEGQTNTHGVHMLPDGATLTIHPVLPKDFRGDVKGEIRLNNVSQGVHPLPHTFVGLKPGTYEIQITGRKWTIESGVPKSILLRQNQDAVIEYELEPAYCTVQVQIRPASARLTVDGIVVRPGKILLAPDETHVLRAEAHGYQLYVEEFRLGPNQGKWIDVKLKRR